MKLREYSILRVKYAGKDWSKFVEYKAKQGRNLGRVQEYFSKKPNFRYCIVLNKQSRIKTGYLDRYKIEYKL